MSKTITQTTTESNSVVLKKGAKDKYNWEIKIYGDSHHEILKTINETNDALVAKYGSNEE